MDKERQKILHRWFFRFKVHTEYNIKSTYHNPISVVKEGNYQDSLFVKISKLFINVSGITSTMDSLRKYS